MDEVKHLVENHTKGINWNAILMLVMFAGGNLFNAGLGFGGSAKDIISIQASVARIETAVSTLAISDRTTYGEMQAIELHLKNTDKEVSDLKATLEAFRNRVR